MPRKTIAEIDQPRQHGKGAAAIDSPAERGLLLRALLYSPKDLVAGLAAFAAVSAIIANAVFMQAGRHPSPMFGPSAMTPLASQPIANPLPRRRPIEAETRIADKPLDSRLFESSPAPTRAAAHADAPAPVKAAAASRPQPSSATRGDPVGDLIINTRRVASVQRALTEFGYGQLKTTGNAGSDTQAAIQKFERERKMPVTGQVSDRLVRELTAMTGRPLE